MIPRVYQNLEQYLEPNKALVLFGPRQVGKTTLVKEYLRTTKYRYLLDTGDNIITQQTLGSGDLAKIKDYVGQNELVVIDEAQRIPNIGMALKLIVDQIPGIRIIVTGSSSFDLAGQIGEPLVGRKRSLTLYPIAQMELAKLKSPYDLKQGLSDQLVYGSFPAVASASSKEKKREILEDMVQSYLFKDILEFERVKGAKVLLDLLRLLAFQVGSEVSVLELARQLEIDSKTVARYLDLFEKAFLVYNLRGYSRNLRREIVSKSKFYFWDNGLRNAVIASFNDLESRDDIGKLWENFLVVERLKMQSYTPLYANNYFWRTWDQEEVDWVEEREGKLFGFEFKYSPNKRKKSGPFLEAYKEASLEVVNRDNFLQFAGVM